MSRQHPESEQESAEDLRPSRSARKRAAESLQKLGEYLLTLRESDLRELELPETLLDAVLEGQRVRPGPALARQKQYIGKLMRTVDLEALEKALALKPDEHRSHVKLSR
ncbi:MAG: ribosome biogenesis factor YjgA [Steroidobacteraceae bacterium]